MHSPQLIAPTTLIFILLLAHFSSPALVYIPDLPVPKITLVRA